MNILEKWLKKNVKCEPHQKAPFFRIGGPIPQHKHWTMLPSCNTIILNSNIQACWSEGSIVLNSWDKKFHDAQKPFTQFSVDGYNKNKWCNSSYAYPEPNVYTMCFNTTITWWKKVRKLLPTMKSDPMIINDPYVLIGLRKLLFGSQVIFESSAMQQAQPWQSRWAGYKICKVIFVLKVFALYNINYTALRSVDLWLPRHLSQLPSSSYWASIGWHLPLLP